MSYGNISNAALGAKIKRDHRRHLERIERMTPIWEEEGKKLRHLRESNNISRKTLSCYVGISDQVIAKVEKGKSVRSRNMLVQSIKTSIAHINCIRYIYCDKNKTGTEHLIKKQKRSKNRG